MAGRLSSSTSATMTRAGSTCPSTISPSVSKDTAAITSSFSGSRCFKADVPGLPSFPAADKRKDPRYRWFVKNFGHRCWELDAMDPRDLRERVTEEIKELIDAEAWERCATREPG